MNGTRSATASARSSGGLLSEVRSRFAPHSDPLLASGAREKKKPLAPLQRGEGGVRISGRVRGAPREPLAERVLYRDGLILVIDKPAGIAVHPGPGGGPNLESGFDELRFGLPHPPALAHRLDRDTSGCLVLGRHPKALRRLGALF